MQPFRSRREGMHHGGPSYVAYKRLVTGCYHTSGLLSLSVRKGVPLHTRREYLSYMEAQKTHPIATPARYPKDTG